MATKIKSGNEDPPPLGSLFNLKLYYGDIPKGVPNYFKASGVVALSVKAPKVEDINQRRAQMDFVCLVDTSRSMSGGFSQQGKNKLAQVMSCFQHLVTFLGDRDRFSVYLFAMETKRLFGLIPMSKKNKWYVNTTLTQHITQPQGGTDLLNALEYALQELANPRRVSSKKKNNERAASIWIFSDGIDTHARENIPDDVSNIRKPIRLLTDRQLSQKIRNLIGFYEPMIKGGFSINTFGFGDQNDGFILNEFARLGHGTYYYVRATDILKQEQEFFHYFSDCLNRELAIVAQSVTATLELSDGAIIRQVADLEPDNISIAKIGDVYQEMETSVMWDIDLSVFKRPGSASPSPGREPTKCMAVVTVQYQNLMEDGEVQVQGETVVFNPLSLGELPNTLAQEYMFTTRILHDLFTSTKAASKPGSASASSVSSPMCTDMFSQISRFRTRSGQYGSESLKKRTEEIEGSIHEG